MAPDSKVPTTITFRKPGTQPPVFVAGSYSEPQWQPQEMSCAVDAAGEYVFEAEILANPGSSIQYKFRLGNGDWWALDDTVESVTDNLGNRNNILRVPAAASAPPTPEIRLPDDNGAWEGTPDNVGPFGPAVSGWLDPFAARRRAPPGDDDDDDWDLGQDRVPLFAHECLESHDGASISGGSPPHSPVEPRHSLGFEHEPDKLELDDPELEEFPSRLEQISELIHEVEEELEEDETAFEGVPPSAVLGVPRRKTNDVVGDFIGGSPTISPTLSSRPVKRLVVPRASMGSVCSDVSSALSLQSIAEGGEEDDGDQGEGSPNPVVLLPSPVARSSMPVKSPTSEDDEAVVLESSKRKPAATLAPTGPQNEGSSGWGRL